RRTLPKGTFDGKYGLSQGFPPLVATSRRAESSALVLVGHTKRIALNEVPTPPPAPPKFATLQEALIAHGAPLDEAVVAALDKYAQIVWEMNQSLNLTRHTDYDKFVGRDVLDSLA